MWSKISHALKPKQGQEEFESSTSHAPVLSSVYEQHPNLSIFYDEPRELPFPNASPPVSPSKNGHRGMFKRIPKMPWGDEAENASSSKLSLSLPSKLKNSIDSKENGSEISLPRPPMEASRPSQDTAPRDSQDSLRRPHTPVDTRSGSLRSILRDPNAPATGQSVRFFSRDAYKVITPDTSTNTEPELMSLFDRLQQSKGSDTPESTKQHPRPVLTEDMFSPSKMSSPFPATPGDISRGFDSFVIPPLDVNIFDLSQSHEVPAIPVNTDNPLLANAIEMFEAEDVTEEADTSAGLQLLPESSTPYRKNQSTSFFTAKSSEHTLDRSKSFSFGQTVFHSMANSSSSDSPRNQSADEKSQAHYRSPNSGLAKRGRALSDSVFQSMLRSPSAPEAEIDDPSAGIVVYTSPEPDPFSVNATTYYTPQTNIPPTPPSKHSRKSSREEDMILSLKTQLALQQEMCNHYEIDLKARDELVGLLAQKLEQADRDGEKRKGALRQWKKKVLELERACRHLEEEVDQSRQESFERSVMDEASGEAMMHLHKQISRLQMEKAELERREATAREEQQKLKDEALEKDGEVKRLEEELTKREECERELKEGIRAANEQMGMMGTQLQTHAQADEKQELKQLVVKREQVVEEEAARHREIEFAWDEERARLMTHTDELRTEKQELVLKLEGVQKELVGKAEELALLKNELEAQWKNTENMNDKIHVLVQERDGLKGEVEAFEERIATMEVDWNEHENRKAELETEAQEAWSAKEEAERERQQLEEELRAEHAELEGLTHALQEREDRIADLDRERQYALDTVSRLEDNVRQRNLEVADHARRIVERETEVEHLREEMSSLKREQSRLINEQNRALQDAAIREGEARASMEMLVQEKAEVDVALKTSNDRVVALTEEIDKLRRQVHALQQESADKDIRIVQLTKQRAQDKEDINGMNIALESKQQELELLKRRLGVRGTAGSTPAPSKIVHHRRESSASVAPMDSRPSSALSDIIKAKERASTQTPSGAPTSSATALGKSTRGNRNSTSTSSVGSATPSTVKAVRAIPGSMGPPPMKAKAPATTTTTPTATQPRVGPSSLPRSSATKPPPVSLATSGFHRRTSSVVPDASRLKAATRAVRSPPLSERDEKENVTPSSRLVRRSSVMVPA